LKLRYADFRTLTRDVTLDEPSHLDSVIYENVLRLFKRARNPRLKVRLVGVRASNLERAPFERNLFEAQQREKLDRLYEAADKVRDRFGFDVLQLARSLDPTWEPGSPARKGKPRRQFLGRED